MLTTYHQTKIALGSDVTLLIVADQSQELIIDRLFSQLWIRIFKFEKQFSRFLPNSELTQFNLNAGLKQGISQEFREILVCSKDLSLRTQGRFNPFILPALQRAGYVRSFVPGYENEPQIDFSDRRVAEIGELQIGENWAQIPYGTALDFGGIGKGFLADKLAELMRDQSIEGYWFSLGGDVVGAGYDEAGQPWQVEIDAGNANNSSDISIVTSGEVFAIATSGTQLRKGMFRGKAWHHILDPTTLLPAKTDLYLATIYGNSAVEADVFASTAILLGSEEALKFVEAQATIQSTVLHGINSQDDNFVKHYGEAVKLNKLEVNHV